MTPERWRQITEVFHQALTHSDAERTRFLQQACAGDEGLHAEVRAAVQFFDTNRQLYRAACPTGMAERFQ